MHKEEARISCVCVYVYHWNRPYMFWSTNVPLIDTVPSYRSFLL